MISIPVYDCMLSIYEYMHLKKKRKIIFRIQIIRDKISTSLIIQFCLPFRTFFLFFTILCNRFFPSGELLISRLKNSLESNLIFIYKSFRSFFKLIKFLLITEEMENGK